jgi:hypothetical protein
MGLLGCEKGREEEASCVTWAGFEDVVAGVAWELRLADDMGFGLSSD